jgi:hypothetical protein
MNYRQIPFQPAERGGLDCGADITRSLSRPFVWLPHPPGQSVVISAQRYIFLIKSLTPNIFRTLLSL